MTVDGYGRTNLDGVWALGDITPGHALAHRAFEQGITIAEKIAGADPKPVIDDTVPQVVFSFPEAASKSARRRGRAEGDGIPDAVQRAHADER